MSHCSLSMGAIKQFSLSHMHVLLLRNIPVRISTVCPITSDFMIFVLQAFISQFAIAITRQKNEYNHNCIHVKSIVFNLLITLFSTDTASIFLRIFRPKRPNGLFNAATPTILYFKNHILPSFSNFELFSWLGACFPSPVCFL